MHSRMDLPSLQLPFEKRSLNPQMSYSLSRHPKSSLLIHLAIQNSSHSLLLFGMSPNNQTTAVTYQKEMPIEQRRSVAPIEHRS